jgi:hypothetical protein
MPARHISSNLPFMKRRPNRSPFALQLVFLLLTISVLLAQLIPGGVRRDGRTANELTGTVTQARGTDPANRILP